MFQEATLTSTHLLAGAAPRPALHQRGHDDGRGAELVLVQVLAHAVGQLLVVPRHGTASHAVQGHEGALQKRKVLGLEGQRKAVDDAAWAGAKNNQLTQGGMGEC